MGFLISNYPEMRCFPGIKKPHLLAGCEFSLDPTSPQPVFENSVAECPITVWLPPTHIFTPDLLAPRLD